jgi:hypothetical protein
LVKEILEGEKWAIAPRLLAISALAATLFRLPDRIGKLERHAPPLSVGFFAFVSRRF